MDKRLSFTESFQKIKEEFDRSATGIEGEPYMAASIPNYDDEKFGISFFRGSYKDSRLNGLTLSRTYFGRSEFNHISFINTDLSESRMCWNDWIGCDFSGCDLTSCDLRNSIFSDCKFDNAKLDKADLRHATFQSCTFTGASMKGAQIKKPNFFAKLKEPFKFDKKQEAEIDWQKDNGPKAPGG